MTMWSSDAPFLDNLENITELKYYHRIENILVDTSFLQK